MTGLTYIDLGTAHEKGSSFALVGGSSFSIGSGEKFCISHLPGASVPRHLKADTCAEMAFKFLTDSRWREALKDVGAVSNDQLDFGSLAAVFVLMNPALAIEHREVIEAVAALGDFNRGNLTRAVQMHFVLENHMAKGFISYETLLPIFQKLLSCDLQQFAGDWMPHWQLYQATAEAIAGGRITVKNYPEEDVSVVSVLDPQIDLHLINAIALHTVATCFTVLVMHLPSNSFYLNYRYETYVDYQSASVLPPVDLNYLAYYLSTLELSSKPSEVDDAPVWMFHSASLWLSMLRCCTVAGRDRLLAGDADVDHEPSRLDPALWETEVRRFLAARRSPLVPPTPWALVGRAARLWGAGVVDAVTRRVLG